MSHSNAAGGHARLLGVMGSPVGHSLSPIMHNAAFQSQQMNCFYGALPVEPDQVEAAVRGIRALGYLGVNVTIPHKEAVMEYLDEVAPSARQVGAVNTIVNRAGRLIGYNTDGWGFIASLEEARVRVKGQRTAVLGAGGAAKAIAHHLTMAGVSHLVVINRTLERAEAVVESVRAIVPDLPVMSAAAGSNHEEEYLRQADLVVNCTPMGMAPDYTDQIAIESIGLLHENAVVYDTVYKPFETRLLREARERGLRTVGGLGMLVHQGACAWEYWFGRRGPVPVMFAAARAALEGVNG